MRFYFTIVNEIERLADFTPELSVAVTTSVYRPGRSFLCPDNRPWKRSVFVPACASSVSRPALTLRLQRPGSCSFG